MNLNQISERTVLAILLIVVLISYSIAAKEDYNQQEIEAIPDDAYAEIVEKLGYECSDSEIINEYKTNKEYYGNQARFE